MYATSDAYAAAVTRFARDGLAAGQPVMIAVPGPHVALLRDALGDDARSITFADMAELGRNPARIIPAVRAWITGHDARPSRFVGEPIWPGRSRDEIAEATRHESLLNLAFADAPTSILCPYDRSGLDEATLAAVPCSHHAVIDGGTRAPSAEYTAPTADLDIADWPLPDPPASAWRTAFHGDLAGLRRAIRERAGHLLAPARLDDLLVAANEVATNAMRHGRPPVAVHLWHDAAEVVCEVSDHGRIADPLAGRSLPPVDQDGGRGLWLVHQLCDLSQLRTGPSGTVICLHVARG